MLELLFIMLERLGIIVTMAFILTRFRFFQDMVHRDSLNRKQEFTAILFFGVFGIIGTYFGVAFNTETHYFNSFSLELTSDEAIANSRVIGIVLAGLLGGYKVGIGAGLIAGIHRFTLGGFTGIACGLATIVAGIIAGAFRKKGKHVKLPAAFGIGALAETIQMAIILLIAKPFDKALQLVDMIGIPMILANGVGTAIFLLIIQNVVNEDEKTSAQEAQRTLRIADQTLGYLRKGMNHQSALAVCEILYKEVRPSAVAMTNQTTILAHIGAASDHHTANSPFQTQATQEVIQHGELVIANDDTIHCSNENCPLGAAIIAPLKQRGSTIGTLKLYFKSKKEMTNASVELMSGLSSLLSNQLEIAEADRAIQLAKNAEIKALQAQISPHFLFNSLNVIVSLIRIDSQKARKLLMSLSYFLRNNLSGTTVSMVSLEQELKHIKAYLEIEEARFVDKLQIEYDVDDNVLEKKLPPLTLQPIVENAIKHGIKDSSKDALVKISIQNHSDFIEITVKDNGKGIDPELVAELGTEKIDSKTGTGMGLYNVNRRLIMTFGDNSCLRIKSELEKETQISFRIPNKLEVT
ncbi:sensor histidine kinase [Virgibacillus oceani]|uniref:histidine kinase n=1 Tax=Virgibacillus oceani TaxID=1479511 RepID=A0A917M8D2_9BACI|nr:sensor histidine kinase [Virgibacillus oceani]GGG85693.1 sensor protein LytS [Virgibacillus oceani]